MRRRSLEVPQPMPRRAPHSPLVSKIDQQQRSSSLSPRPGFGLVGLVDDEQARSCKTPVYYGLAFRDGRRDRDVLKGRSRDRDGEARVTQHGLGAARLDEEQLRSNSWSGNSSSHVGSLSGSNSSGGSIFSRATSSFRALTGMGGRRSRSLNDTRRIEVAPRERSKERSRERIMESSRESSGRSRDNSGYSRNHYRSRDNSRDSSRDEFSRSDDSWRRSARDRKGSGRQRHNSDRDYREDSLHVGYSRHVSRQHSPGMNTSRQHSREKLSLSDHLSRASSRNSVHQHPSHPLPCDTDHVPVDVYTEWLRSRSRQGK